MGFGGTPPPAFLSVTLGTTSYGAPVASVWGRDLYTGNDGGVFSGITGTAPYRRFIIRWRVRDFPGLGLPTNSDYEIKLEETSNNIYMVYGNSISAGGAVGIVKDNNAGNFLVKQQSSGGQMPSGTTVCFSLQPACGLVAFTPTPVFTQTSTATATSTVTGTLPPTGTATPTQTLVPPPPPREEKEDKPQKLSDLQELQQQHTNQQGPDHYHARGNVDAFRIEGGQLIVTIGMTRDEKLEIVIPCPDGICPTVTLGESVDLLGEMGDDGRFYVSPP